ncbi:hypothetical protein BSKO_00974 [Bryopsis sp. KO-2023]|nr:hypothetical protein BSKO_00974 [Bryopsis sp. KO-2023]
MEKYTRSSSVTVNGLVVEELVQGIAGCKKLEETVKNTFRSLQDIIKAQGNAIKSLEGVVALKPSKDDVRRISRDSVAPERIIDKITKLEAIVESDSGKRDSQWEALKAEITTKFQQQARESDALNATVTLQSKKLKEMKDKHDASEMELKATVEILTKKVSQLQDEVHELTKRQSLDKTELAGCLETHEALKESINKKANKSQMQSTLEDMERYIKDVSHRTEEKMYLLDKKCSSVADKINGQAEMIEKALKGTRHGCKSRMDEMLSKVEATEGLTTNLGRRMNQVEGILRTERSNADQREFTTKEEMLDMLKAHGNRVAVALNGVATVQDLDGVKEKVLSLFDDVSAVKKGLAGKAERQDADKKPYTSEVNKVLEEVGDALGETATKEEVQSTAETLTREVELLSERINPSSVWQWNCGRTKSNGAVYWDAESLNSDPDNFVWEKDKTFITCTRAGLYKVSTSFFSLRRPTIQVVVNGKSLLTSPPSTRTSNNNSAVLVGATCEDFLSIPERSRVSVKLQGDDRGEGFLALKWIA